MSEYDVSEYLEVATRAARNAGALLAERFRETRAVEAVDTHDIKLAVDVESQDLITASILAEYPDHGILGEEGSAGNAASEFQWIVDPLDGTVNYFYGIPHFGVSIALQRGDRIVAGVIYDPMVDELWSATADHGPECNEREVRVSSRDTLGEAVVSLGFAKTKGATEHSARRFARVAPAVRKIRMLGSAALEMAYVATGRLDAYIEHQVSLWDIAAGKLFVERAGGMVRLEPHHDRSDRYSIVCTNGAIPVEQLIADS